MVVRLLLISTLIPLQSCSNTPIGEKLENSFDNIENPLLSVDSTKVKVQKKQSEIQKIKSSKKNDREFNENKNESNLGNIIKGNEISNKNRLSQKSTKSLKKTIFKPQPYRIILRLSGANPSAPAETVTEALRKAGVQFEVEKIERFDEENFSKNTSSKR